MMAVHRRRLWSTAALVALSAFLAILVTALASCAEDSDPSPSVASDAALIPEAGPAPDVDAESDADVDIDARDAGCDASDPSCITQVASCADVEWCAVPTNVGIFDMLTAVWGTSPNDVWAVGSGGTILHYDGAVWTPTPSGVENTFNAVWGSGPNDVYVVSSTQVILHGTGMAGGTATWTNVPAPLARDGSALPLRAIWGTSANDVRLGGGSALYSFPAPVNVTAANQFVMSSDSDGGLGWKPMPGSPTVLGFWGSSASDVWIVGDNGNNNVYERGKTLHGLSPDAGADAGPAGDPLVWTAVDSQSNLALEAVWGSSASDVWAVGALGTIRHIEVGDVRWQAVESVTNEDLHAIWGSGPDDFWAVGDDGTILHYDGSSFHESSAQFEVGKKPNLYGIWGSARNDVWIVGDGVSLHYTGPKSGTQRGQR